ncbi:hypothetical protein RRG08_020408 [Elysia crispata]|uniref:Uncharacterized protein n=1 Tax=Elysia crispata TaxID=231223 RepID=A0AAE1B4T6_9GAST|nr:hypothetical protein RRG08_020408 [Elysia crispata]
MERGEGRSEERDGVRRGAERGEGRSEERDGERRGAERGEGRSEERDGVRRGTDLKDSCEQGDEAALLLAFDGAVACYALGLSGTAACLIGLAGRGQNYLITLAAFLRG